MCCLSPVYIAATEQTSKPWDELNLVTGGSHGNEAAAAPIPPGANKSDKYLDSKAGFHSPP